MKRSILLISVMAVILSALPLFATDYYEKGNTFFELKVGIDVPAFVSFPNKSGNEVYKGTSETHLKLGGVGSLSYQGCVTPKIAIGGEIGYCFNYAIDGNIFTQVPITAKASFILIQNNKFDFNIDTNLGIEFLKSAGTPNIVPFASVSLKPVFYFNESWGVGLDAGFGLFAEFVRDNKPNNAIYGQLPATICLMYRN